MKILLIAITCLAVATSVVLGVIAGRSCSAKGEVEKERDALAERVRELEEGRIDRAKFAVELLGIAPDPEGDGDAREPLSADHVRRCLEFLVLMNRHLETPLRAGFLNVKNLLDEMRRALGTASRKVDEYKIEAENWEDRRRDYESAIRNLRTALDKPRTPDRIVRRLEDTIRALERQVTDLRERIRNLSSENERLAEEIRKQIIGLRSRIVDLEFEKGRHRQALLVARPFLRTLLPSPLPKHRFGAARVLDAAGWLTRGELAGLEATMRSPLKGDRTEAVQCFMDRRRHGAVYSALHAAFHDTKLPPERRLEVLERLLERRNPLYRLLAAKWARTLPPGEREEAGELFARYDGGFCLPLWASLLDSKDDSLASSALRNLQARFPRPVGGEAPIQTWEQAFLEYGDDSLGRTLHWVRMREKAKEIPVPPGPLRLSVFHDTEWLLMKDVRVRARVLDESWDGLPLALEPRDRPLETVLQESAKTVGASLAYRRGCFLVGSNEEIAAWDAEHPPWDTAGTEGPPWRFELALRLEEPKAGFDFMDTPILEVAEDFGRKFDVDLLVVGEAADPDLIDDMYVQLKVDQINGREVITLTGHMKELRHDFRWGVLLWGRERDLDSLYDIPLLSPRSGHPAAMEWNEKLVTLDLRNATVRDLFHILVEKHEIYMTFAPDLPPGVLEERVGFQVRDVTVAQALHLILVPRGLTLKAPEKGTAPVVCLRR